MLTLLMRLSPTCMGSCLIKYEVSIVFQWGSSLLHTLPMNVHLEASVKIEMLKYLIEQGLSLEQPGKVK